MLEIIGLSRTFGAIKALDAVDIQVPHGEVVGLIGPNGSGKSTLVNILTGLDKPDAGAARFNGIDILTLKPFQIAQLGIARTFQNVRIFPMLTVRENIDSARFSLASSRKAATQEALVAVKLADDADMLAKNLPLPARRRLELARAMVRDPKLILLDEPAGGMTPKETADMAQLIKEQIATGRTCLVIEHKMHLILQVCSRICVLNHGRLIADGVPGEVLHHPDVLEVYLGSDHGANA